MKKICIIYIKAGGGHLATAKALEAALVTRGHKVDLLDIRTILNHVDPLYKLTGIKAEGIYDWQIRRGWNVGQERLLRLAQWFISKHHQQLMRKLAGYFLETFPEVIVSVMPNFNREIEAAAQYTDCGRCYVVMTDFEDSYEPHFWLESYPKYPSGAYNVRNPATIITPTDRAYRQAARLRSDDDVVQVSGCVVHPKFYYGENVRRDSQLGALGPIGMVMYGGNGSERMVQLAQALNGENVALVFICGNNAKVKARIDQFKNNPWLVLGYVSDIECYMRQCHYFIGKPGPGCISEALVSGLPLLLDSHNMMRQEFFNRDWAVYNQFGKSTSEPWRDLEDYWKYLPDYSKNIAANYNNKAVFEVADLLEDN